MQDILFCNIAESPKTPEGSIWEVTVIRAGMSKNNKYYPAEVLQQACHLFEKAPLAIYDFSGDRVNKNDHVPTYVRDQYPGGVAKNVVGFLENVRMINDEMVATAHIIDESIRSKLLEAWNKKNPDIFQLSIEASGTLKNVFDESTGSAIPTVTKIEEAQELTIVTRGAAGGRFRRLIASETAFPVEVVLDENQYHLVSKEEFEKSFNTQAAAMEAWKRVIEGMEESNNVTQEGEVNQEEVTTILDENLPVSEPEEALTETEPQPCEEVEMSDTQNILESTSSRAAICKALRALSYTASLEECTTKDLIGLLENQIEVAAKSQDINESVQQNLLQILEALNKGNAVQAISALEDMIMSLQEGYQQKLRLNQIKESNNQMDKPVEQPAEGTSLDALYESHAKRMAEIERQGRISVCDMQLASTLRESGLPKVGQDAIEKAFKGTIFEMEALTEAISNYRNIYEAGFTKAGGNSNAPKIDLGPGRLEKLKAQAEILTGFDYTKLSESKQEIYRTVADRNPSLAGWYGEVTDDRNMSGKFGPNSLFREATTSSIPELLGDAMNKTLLQKYTLAEAAWQSVAEIVSVKDFKTINNYIFGGFGILPTISETDSNSVEMYERLGIGADERIQYNAAQRGGMVALTRMMIMNDDLGSLRRIPADLADTCYYTLEQLVFQALIGGKGGTINGDLSYDGVALFHNNHRNLGTAAMSVTALIDSWNRLRRQCRFGNVGTLGGAVADGVVTTWTLSAALYEAVKVGDQLHCDAEVVKVTAKLGSNQVTVVRGQDSSTGAAHSNGARVEQRGRPIINSDLKVLYPYLLEGTASVVFNSEFVPGTSNNDRNLVAAEVRANRLKPIALHENFLMGDINNYYLVAGKPVQVAFVGGRQVPELFYQSGDTDNGPFMRDLYTWKCRHEYGISTPDHKYIDGNIVA